MTEKTRLVGTWLGGGIIEASPQPEGLPDDLETAVWAFVDGRDTLPAEAVKWAEEQSDPQTAALFARVVENGALLAMPAESVGMDHRWVGMVAIAPVLIEMGDDAWAITGDDPPEDWDNPFGIWLYGVTVLEPEWFDRLIADRMVGARRLAHALAAGDWGTCDHCECPYDRNDATCIRGCAENATEN
jgi:hypothetical protein